MFGPISVCPLSPEGAGVGPAQLVSFPHQETAKDAVEDVSLLGRTIRGKRESSLLKIFVMFIRRTGEENVVCVKPCWGHFKGNSTPPPHPASVVTCGWQISSPLSLASSIQTEFGGKTRLRKLTVLEKPTKKPCEPHFSCR